MSITSFTNKCDRLVEKNVVALWRCASLFLSEGVESFGIYGCYIHPPHEAPDLLEKLHKRLHNRKPGVE